MNILMQDGSTMPKDDVHCTHCVNWLKTDWPCSLCILKPARPSFVCEPDPKKWMAP